VDFKKCGDCEIDKNLWLCMHCGNVGCGRKYFDGTGANNHGVDHYKAE
jgi:ubiquitin carboxyl-terminal hydrolase 5/13